MFQETFIPKQHYFCPLIPSTLNYHLRVNEISNFPALSSGHDHV